MFQIENKRQQTPSVEPKAVEPVKLEKKRQSGSFFSSITAMMPKISFKSADRVIQPVGDTTITNRET